MNRAETLDAAKQCVTADRNNTYGEPEDAFRSASVYMSRYLYDRGKLAPGEVLEPFDVAGLMLCLKLARLGRNPHHADTAVDIAGYAATFNECIEKG